VVLVVHILIVALKVFGTFEVVTARDELSSPNYALSCGSLLLLESHGWEDGGGFWSLGTHGAFPEMLVGRLLHGRGLLSLKNIMILVGGHGLHVTR